MEDTEKTKSELIDELRDLRLQVARLKDSEALLKKNEMSLKEEAVGRRMLVEQSYDGIVILTVDGKVYEANQKYADMLGYTLDEVHQLYLWDWDKNHSIEELLKMADVVNETGAHFETKHTRKDGSVFDVEISTNGTMCGNKKLIFCVCRDISERKKHEEQLRESKEQLSAFIDNFNGIAYQVNINDILQFKPMMFRGAIKQITGYLNEEFSDQFSWNDIIHPDDLQSVLTVRNNFLHDQSYTADIEYRILNKDDTIKWVCDVSQIIKIRNENLIHGTIFDITQRKSAEETNLKLEERIRCSQKLEAIGTLAGGVAHDFNNVLSIIMGYNDLARKDLPPDSKTFAKLKQIEIASIRARDIIRQLLTFSRKVGLKKQPFNIGFIIDETISFLHSTLPANIQIDYKQSNEELFVFADPTQMHQVFMNLCVNASQSMEKSGGTIKIVTEKVNFIDYAEIPFKDISAGAYIKVTVSDSGQGISQDIINRIFDPYFTTRETGKGSGMGLAVVHGIIGNHGGSINVSSEIGKGTSFTFIIPAHNRVKPVLQSAQNVHLRGVESILFVDDEEEIVTITKQMLEEHGFKVVSSTNPLAALEIFKSKPYKFDIVITDLAMPHMTGDVLLKNIKEIRPEIPVILCTGHNYQIDEKKAVEMNLAAFYLKPLNCAELVNTIRNSLDNNKTDSI